MTPEKIATLWVGLLVANFVYQAITAQRFSLAAERSFFQGVAIAATYFAFAQ